MTNESEQPKDDIMNYNSDHHLKEIIRNSTFLPNAWLLLILLKLQKSASEGCKGRYFSMHDLNINEDYILNPEHISFITKELETRGFKVKWFDVDTVHSNFLLVSAEPERNPEKKWWQFWK